jgi:hypothetical protein
VHLRFAGQVLIEAAGRVNIVILQVERLQLVIVPREAVAFDIALKDAMLGRPVETVGRLCWIGFEVREDRLPGVDNSARDDVID